MRRQPREDPPHHCDPRSRGGDRSTRSTASGPRPGDFTRKTRRDRACDRLGARHDRALGLTPAPLTGCGFEVVALGSVTACRRLQSIDLNDPLALLEQTRRQAAPKLPALDRQMTGGRGVFRANARQSAITEYAKKSSDRWGNFCGFLLVCSPHYTNRRLRGRDRADPTYPVRWISIMLDFPTTRSTTARRVSYRQEVESQAPTRWRP